MTTVLKRTTFETSRLLEFFSEGKLKMQSVIRASGGRMRPCTSRTDSKPVNTGETDDAAPGCSLGTT